MAATLILDTGPLVAILDRDEREHRRCVDFYGRWSGEVVTTEAVVTEATHLLSGHSRGIATCIEFVRRGGALVVAGGLDRLERTLELVTKYGDVPMDYADATLVALAEELETPDVFTLDLRGFRAYRWNGRRTFRVHP